MMDLRAVQIEDLIRCLVAHTEPVVRADYPESCAQWSQWLSEGERTLAEVSDELNSRSSLTSQ